MAFFTRILKQSFSPLTRMYSSKTKHPYIPLIDWRHEGCVTPAKDQGPKGICYAVSVADGVETAHAIATKELLVLSPQELLDHMEDTRDSDGSGGKVYEALDYAKYNGISLLDDYPFVGFKQEPKILLPGSPKVFVNYQEVEPYNFEIPMLCSLQKGPLVTSLNVGGLFDDYDGTTILFGEDENPSCEIRHTSLIVGAGHFNGTPVWALKGTYNEDWGDMGFFYIFRSCSNKYNKGPYEINLMNYLITK